MKKFVLFAAIILLSSFGLNNSYPCHALGDLGPCQHAVHAGGDLGPCNHTYWDAYGNLCRQHYQDVYPCTHPVHSAGDLYPCTHICW